jgi:hypothetical protein
LGIVELTRTHHLILFCAIDDLPLATLLLGMEHLSASGERFTLVPPIPREDARRAALDLLEAGAISVSYAADDRELDLAEARTTLADPATWDVESSAPHSYELLTTPAGHAMFEEAHRLYGDEIERSLEEARARYAEFLRRHPDFVEKNARYLKALERWLTWGGRQPEPPRFD